MLGGFKDLLWYSDPEIRWHHHPQMCISLVVDDIGAEGGIGHIINHLANFIRLNRFAHHISDLLLTELMADSRSHRVSKGMGEERIVQLWHIFCWLVAQLLDEEVGLSDLLDEFFVHFSDWVGETVERFDTFAEIYDHNIHHRAQRKIIWQHSSEARISKLCEVKIYLLAVLNYWSEFLEARIEIDVDEGGQCLVVMPLTQVEVPAHVVDLARVADVLCACTK